MPLAGVTLGRAPATPTHKDAAHPIEPHSMATE
jgi:hypothetical protein